MVCHDGARAREQHFASIAGARPGLLAPDIGITGATDVAVFAASPELYMTGAP